MRTCPRVHLSIHFLFVPAGVSARKRTARRTKKTAGDLKNAISQASLFSACVAPGPFARPLSLVG